MMGTLVVKGLISINFVGLFYGRGSTASKLESDYEETI